MLPDGSDSYLRRLRYSGPGAVLVTIEHERGGRVVERGSSGTARSGLRSALTLSAPLRARPLERAQVIVLGRGSRLRVRSGG